MPLDFNVNTIRYKIYFHNHKVNIDYPVTIVEKDINALAVWLNRYITRWGLTALYGQIIDSRGIIIDNVDFIPSELESQKFVETYEERLLEYYNYHFGGAV
jgi:hypothetical protein